MTQRSLEPPISDSAISVVIPVLNEGSRLELRLQELALAGYEEIVVVDGGSTDETERVANSHKSVARVQWLSARGGRGPQLNLGAESATHETLLFLHADVRLPVNSKRLILTCLRNPKVIAGCFRTWHINDTNTPISRLRRWSLHLADVRPRYTRHPYGDQGLFLRRTRFVQAGGYPEQPLMEDLEFSKSLRRLGPIRTLRQAVEVSGRRFLKQPFRTFLIHNTFPLLYGAGISPNRLSLMYQRVR